MPRPVVLVLALVLGAACAGLLACGKTNLKLLPPGSADNIQTDLDNVSQAVDGTDCAGAARAVRALQADIARLPAHVDARLRRRLREGADHLAATAPRQCQQTQTTQTETVPTTTTTTPATTTAPPTTTPTATTPPPTTTTPPATQPGTTTTTGGGASAPGGGG
jgi:hypothetical protein